MSRTAEALIESPLLVWARKAAGLDQGEAAKKAGVDLDRLIAWEAGEKRPTIAQLRELARVYKRPLAIFYLPEPPTDYQPLRDYRRLPDAESGRLSPLLLATIRRARAVREASLELREIADDPVSPTPVIEGAGNDPERVGDAARELLGVSLDVQRAWPNPRRALNAWIDAVTRLDVLVLQAQKIPIDEMRGVSMAEDRLPVIVLNGGDFPNGRTFTLMHELAHLLIHAGGVCDVLPRRGAGSPTDEIELFCNRVAAAVLMPADAFRAEPAVAAGAPSDGRWPEPTIESLAATYSVSREAVVRRLYTFGLTDWDFLQAKRTEYREAYNAYREEQARQRREEGKRGPGFYRMKVRDLGRNYIESALDAYHRRAITGSDLTEYLEIKVGQVPKLEAELAATGGQRD